MAMFKLPVRPDNTVLLKKAAKLSIAEYKTDAELNAVLAIWRTAVEADTAAGARTLGMTSGATTTTYGYESADDVVLNEKTITALGARTAVTTAALANPTSDNEALVYALSDVTPAAGQARRQVLDSSGVLPTVAFCRDYLTIEIDEDGNGAPAWTRAIFAESTTGTDDAARVEGVETNVTTLPLSIKATARSGYELVEIITFHADGTTTTGGTDTTP